MASPGATQVPDILKFQSLDLIMIAAVPIPCDLRYDPSLTIRTDLLAIDSANICFAPSVLPLSCDSSVYLGHGWIGGNGLVSIGSAAQPVSRNSSLLHLSTVAR